MEKYKYQIIGIISLFVFAIISFAVIAPFASSVDSYEGTLSALDEKGLKGTFFCVGWIAEHHPQVIRDIANAGHHLGCHSYQHELATRFTREEFKEDTYSCTY